MKLEVENHDNRGTEDYPYGFLYFNDGRRMAYALGKIHGDAAGGWKPLTPKHVLVGKRYADSHGLIKENL